MAALSIRPQRMIQDFHLVKLNANRDEEDHRDYHHSITQLEQVVNKVNRFVDADECIDFITDIEEVQVFLIVSEKFTELLISIAQDIRQISSIYILSMNKTSDEKLTNECHKVNGVFTDIASICEAIKHDVRSSDSNAISISFVKTAEMVSSKQSINSVDKSFMYTQILKEILLTIDFEQIHINEFLAYCRELFIDNTFELRNINKIEEEYHSHKPIWWYTYHSFLYSMLNRALRLMEVDIITKMGFFLKDLHNHIVELHSQQYTRSHDSKPFTVYRGQGLSLTDFSELQQTQGGLLSFNNFLSTSTNRDVSLKFVRRTGNSSDLVGVLFVIQVHPSISTTPFANIKYVSSYKGEDEILFSMHSIFRIGQIKHLDSNTGLWEVDLTLTSDNDPQLHELTEYIRKETFPHKKGWYRLSELLIKLGQFDKAEQVCDILLDQTTDQEEKKSIYNMLGTIKNNQGKYEDAVKCYEQSNEIQQKFLSPTQSDFATSYSSLGSVYINMGEYSKALSFSEKALEIYQKTLPENHPLLAISYNNIGGVYINMREYSKALSYYEKALEIRQKTLPENHPLLAASYNNIATVSRNMGEYSKALSLHEKALQISKRTLPPHHPSLVTSYNNIGLLYDHMKEYAKALSYYEKALEIRQKTLCPNHPSLATSYKDMGALYYYMNDYRKALQYYEYALDILQRSSPLNQLHIQVTKQNIEIVKKKL